MTNKTPQEKAMAVIAKHYNSAPEEMHSSIVDALADMLLLARDYDGGEEQLLSTAQGHVEAEQSK